MALTFAVRASQFGTALAGREGGRGRLGGEREMTSGISWLSEFGASPDQGVLVQDALGDHLRVKIREVGHILHGLLKVGEMVRHGVEENHGENVVVFDFAHDGGAAVIASHFSKCIAERCIVVETNFKNFHEKADLGVSALVFVPRAETDKEIVRGSTGFDVVKVCSGDSLEHEGTEVVIILHPYIVSIS